MSASVLTDWSRNSSHIPRANPITRPPAKPAACEQQSVRETRGVGKICGIQHVHLLALLIPLHVDLGVCLALLQQHVVVALLRGVVAASQLFVLLVNCRAQRHTALVKLDLLLELLLCARGLSNGLLQLVDLQPKLLNLRRLGKTGLGSFAAAGLAAAALTSLIFFCRALMSFLAFITSG